MPQNLPDHCCAVTVRSMGRVWSMAYLPYLGYCRGSLVTFMHTRDGRKEGAVVVVVMEITRTHSLCHHPYHAILYSTLRLLTHEQDTSHGGREGPWMEWKGKQRKRKGNATHPAPSGSWHSPLGLYVYLHLPSLSSTYTVQGIYKRPPYTRCLEASKRHIRYLPIWYCSTT